MKAGRRASKSSNATYRCDLELRVAAISRRRADGQNATSSLVAGDFPPDLSDTTPDGRTGRRR